MAALMADNSAVHHWNLHGAQGGNSLLLCLPRVRDWYRQSGERPVCPRVRPSPPKPALAAKCPHTPAACLAKCFGNTVSRRSRGSASSLCVFRRRELLVAASVVICSGDGDGSRRAVETSRFVSCLSRG